MSQTPEDKEKARLHLNNMMKSVQNRKAYVHYIFNKISPHHIQKVFQDTHERVISKPKYREIAYQVIQSCVIEYEQGKFGLIHPTTGELHAESNGLFTTSIRFSYYIGEEFVANDFYGYVSEQMVRYGKKLDEKAKILHRQNDRLTRLKKEAPLKKYQMTKTGSQVLTKSGSFLSKFFRFMGSIPVSAWTNIFSTGGESVLEESDFAVSIYHLIAELCDGKLPDKELTPYYIYK